MKQKQYILTLNAGSSSLRYMLFTRNGKPVLRANVERIGARGGTYKTHADAFQDVRTALRRKNIPRAAIIAVGHRVVHGGPLYRMPVPIRAAVEDAIRTAVPLAPLHNPAALTCIRRARRAFPHALSYAVFDTGLYADLPTAARIYALPRRVLRKYNIQRYGFHGLSHEHVILETAERMGIPRAKMNIISLHLGSGASITAVHNGKAIATSMGFTPMEGLLMTTRVGDIDPGVLLYLLKQGMSVSELERMLDKESGWFGLTGKKDFRDVLFAAGFSREAGAVTTPISRATRAAAKDALALFFHRAQLYISGYAALLPRIDAIVFTGGIGGENAKIRRAIMRSLRMLRGIPVFGFRSEEGVVIAQHGRRLLARRRKRANLV